MAAPGLRALTWRGPPGPGPWCPRGWCHRRCHGAGVLDSFPCALWCFRVTPEDFETTLCTTVAAGHDADTVRAMASTVSGAYHGLSGLPTRLLDDLEFRDHLIALADGLHDWR